MYETSTWGGFQGVVMIKSDFVKRNLNLADWLIGKDTMWGGLSFRQSEAVIALLGWSF